MVIPVLLSGGVGSRLWPVSRKLQPKQCLRIVNEKYSMLQETLERLASSGCVEVLVGIESLVHEHKGMGIKRASVDRMSRGRSRFWRIRKP